MLKKVNKKGFTLVEILAVIIIIGLVALIAVPNVRKFIDQAKERKCQADKEAIRDLIKADITEKITLNKPVYIADQIEKLECIASKDADSTTESCSTKYGITEIKETIDNNRYEKYKSKNITVKAEQENGVTEYSIEFGSDFCN